MQQRITMPEIRNHEWFLKNLPADLMDDSSMSSQFVEPDQPMQSSDEIMQIIAEATIPAPGTRNLSHCLAGDLDFDDDLDMDMDMDLDDLETDPDLDVDSSGEIVYAM